MPILVPTTIHHHTTHNYCIMLLYMRQGGERKILCSLSQKNYIVSFLLYPTFSYLYACWLRAHTSVHYFYRHCVKAWKMYRFVLVFVVVKSFTWCSFLCKSKKKRISWIWCLHTPFSASSFLPLVILQKAFRYKNRSIYKGVNWYYILTLFNSQFHEIKFTMLYIVFCMIM